MADLPAGALTRCAGQRAPRRLLAPRLLNTAMNSPLASAETAVASISPVEDIVAELRAGRMVILVDEEDRENEGDIVIASQFITPEAINFMVTHCRGAVPDRWP